MDSETKSGKQLKHGAPGGIRTPNPQIRSLMLYPVELRARLQIVVWFKPFKLFNSSDPSGLTAREPIENKRSPSLFQKRSDAGMVEFADR